MDTLGKRLYYRRKEKGISQEKLAIILGKKTKQVISNWENDRTEPSINDIRQIAEALNTTASYLIDGLLITQDPAEEYVPKSKYLNLVERLNTLLEAENERLKKEVHQ